MTDKQKIDELTASLAVLTDAHRALAARNEALLRFALTMFMSAPLNKEVIEDSWEQCSSGTNEWLYQSEKDEDYAKDVRASIDELFSAALMAANNNG